MLFLSCEKNEGKGGTSTIEGHLKIINLNNQGEFISSYAGADEDIYIIYGLDGLTYDDKMSTSLDGSYRFDYLNPGSYQIFAYSKCDTCASGKEAIIKTVVISEKKEVVNAGEIVTYD